MTNELIRGGPNELDAKDVVATDEDTSITRNVRSVQALDDIILTLPTDRTPGQRHFLVAAGGSITLLASDGTPILNGTFVPAGSRAVVEFSFLASLNTFAWIVEGSGGGIGTGEILVPDFAAVVALDDVSLPDNIYARPFTVKQPFELVKTSTIAADGVTVLPTKSSNNGALPGRWLRKEIFVKEWSLAYLTSAYIDPVNGDDENAGTTSNLAVKTCAEICRRLHQAQAGRNYQLNLLNDVPFEESTTRPFGTVKVRDEFRPSFLEESNDENVLANGNEQVFNMTLIGQRRATGIVGTLTDDNGSGFGYLATTGGVQATLADAAFPGGIAAHIGDMIEITGGTAPAGDVGATTFVGKDLGGGRARVAAFTRQDNTSAGNLPIGSTYEIKNLTKWNASITQIGTSQGRYGFANIEFPPSPAPPADQNNVAIRFASFSLTRCRMRRSIDFSTSHSPSALGCAFDYHGQTGNGPDGTFPLLAVQAAFAATNPIFINTAIRSIVVNYMLLSGAYLQDSFLETVASTLTTSFSSTNLPPGTSQGFIIIAGTGIGVYDWPAAAKAGIYCVDLSLVRFIGASFPYGSSATPGAVGVKVQAGSKMFFNQAFAPAQGITGPLVALNVDDLVNAMPRLEDSAGGVLPALQAYDTWANFLGAPFNGSVMSYTTGAAIAVSPTF